MSTGMLNWHLSKHRALVADLKQHARTLTKILVEAGYVRPRPATCERCGGSAPDGQVIQCHHLSYLDPFDIAWLCVKCHAAAHRSARTWQARWDASDHAA